MAIKCSFIVAVALVAACTAQTPSITADGTQISVKATDFSVQTDAASKPISLVELAQRVASLESELQLVKAENQGFRDRMNDTYPTLDVLDAAIDASSEGLTDQLSTAQAIASQSLNDRVDGVRDDIAGLDATKSTVVALSSDVNYLLSHVDNVTKCAADGQVHVGNGSCVTAVPQCDKPSTPTGANVSLSSSYIIPGVTASYSCNKEKFFLKGSKIRTCLETKAFDDDAPQCLECKVVNCALCEGAQDTCGKCEYGHGLSTDKKKCDELQTTVALLGKGHYNCENEILKPNSQSWSRIAAFPIPYSPDNGAAALIKGTIYAVTFTKGGLAYKLKQGDSSWSSYPQPPWAPKAARLPFYTTLNGVGNKEDGFYMISSVGSAVWQPGLGKWTQLPLISQSQGSLRIGGATASIGNKIYCIGGQGDGAAKVDVFDTTKRTWTPGVDLQTPRHSLAGASYNGKIYAIGGIETAGNVLSTKVEMFDPSKNKWVYMQEMSEPMASMGTELPVFAGGKILIPEAVNGGVKSRSYAYQIAKNEWSANFPAPAVRKGNTHLLVWGFF